MFRGLEEFPPTPGVGQPIQYLAQGTVDSRPRLVSFPAPAIDYEWLDTHPITPNDVPPPPGTYFAPEDIVWPSLTKAGVIESSKGGKRPMNLGTLAGTYVHTALYAGMCLDADERAERYNDLHADLPPLIKGWLDAGTKLVPIIEKITAPDKDHLSVRAGETPIYLGKDTKSSIGVIQDRLIDEQLRLDGRPGPIAYILRAYYSTEDNREERLKAAMSILTDESSISKDKLMEHLEMSRTHTVVRTERGNVFTRLTVRPDLLDFQFPEGDAEAGYAATALVEVLKAGAGFDLEKIHDLKVPFTEVGHTGVALEKMIDAPTAVRKAVDLMLAGKISVRYFDYKVQGQTSEEWRQRLSKAWETSGHNLEEMFSDDKVYGTDPQHAAVRKYWADPKKGIETNLTGGVRAVAEFFEFAHHESLRQSDEDNKPSAISWEQIAEHIRAIAILINFDVAKIRENLQPNAISTDHISSDATPPFYLTDMPSPVRISPYDLSYKTSPPFCLAGVPSTIPVYAKEVKQKRLREKLGEYGKRIHSDVIGPYIGKIATAAEEAS